MQVSPYCQNQVAIAYGSSVYVPKGLYRKNSELSAAEGRRTARCLAGSTGHVAAAAACAAIHGVGVWKSIHPAGSSCMQASAHVQGVVKSITSG
jgi:hypothetical protein